MFKVKVFKLRDIVNCLVGILLTILIIVIISKNFHKNTNEKQIVEKVENKITSMSEDSISKCMEKVIVSMSSNIVNNEEVRRGKK